MQSAKTNQNVEQVFLSIAKDIKQRLTESDTKAEVKKHMESTTYLILGLEAVYIVEENRIFVALQPQGIKITKQDANKASSSSTTEKSACCSYV